MNLKNEMSEQNYANQFFPRLILLARLFFQAKPSSEKTENDRFQHYKNGSPLRAKIEPSNRAQKLLELSKHHLAKDNFHPN